MQVIIVRGSFIIFLTFVSLSISCCTAWFSGTDYISGLFCSKDVHNCSVPYVYKALAPALRVKSQTINPPSPIPFIKPTGSMAKGG